MNMINSTTMRACYAPRISSPLNPTADDAAGKAIRRRRRARRTNTLCARLLRAKTQHAWRNQVLNAQLAQYEYELAASQQEPKSPEQKHISVTPTPQNTPRGMTQNIHIPDNCSLKTRRMLLAMGFVGGMPTVTMQKCIRQAVPIMA